MHNKILKFIKALKLKNPIIGIEFTSKTSNNAKHFKDTACTALARVKNKKIGVYFDFEKHGQLCSGANFFLGSKNISDDKVMDIYVNNEHVFENKKVCRQFLKIMPKIPNKLTHKKIIIKPFQIEDNPQVVILIVNPAQAGRILGLLNYSCFNKIGIYPNQPTCLAFFAPLATKLPHINFIDYYDRYFQGKISEKYLWREDEMIISLTREHFFSVINNLTKSPHGAYTRTKKDIKKIDEF